MQNESQHKPNDFSIAVDALFLTEYVLHITDNMNTFPNVKELMEEL